MTPVHFLPALATAVGAIVVRSARAPRSARTRAVAFSALALAASVAVPALEAVQPHWLLYYAVLLQLITFVAVGMTPLSRERSSSTFARILLLGTLSTCSVLVDGLALVLPLWALQVLVVVTELRSRATSAGTARVLAAYHGVSIAALALGAVLVSRGGGGHAALLLLFGIAIREAIFPVHSWLPRSFERAPLGIMVAFAAPQLGVWLHLSELSGELGGELMHRLAQAGALTALVAAVFAVFQRSPRRAVAYLFMSQSGLLLFGIENHSSVAFAGTLLVWFGVGLATSIFAMTVEALEARRGEVDLRIGSGNLASSPRLAATFLVAGLATVGLPATVGFVSEDLVVQGAVHEFPHVSLSLVLVTGLNGLTVVRAFFTLFGGSRSTAGGQDLTAREAVVASIVLLVLFGFGLFPGPLLAQLTGG